jgi:hypothetical protein
MFLISAYLIHANRGALVLRGLSPVSQDVDAQVDAQVDLLQHEQAETMTSSQGDSQNSKISEAFAARLARLEPDEPVRAIVLATRSHRARDAYDAQDTCHKDMGEAESAQGAVADFVEDPFEQVDRCLSTSGGRRLTQRPNALGHIVVETTPRGIAALCGLSVVRVIFEDQPIHPHPPVPSPE